MSGTVEKVDMPPESAKACSPEPDTPSISAIFPAHSNHVLVTGGAGFIGANLIRVLLKTNCKVTVLDNFQSGLRQYLDGLNIEVVEGDILDRTTLQKSLRGVSHVIHLAAQTGVPLSLKDPLSDCRVNVIGTLTLLEASRQHGVKRFVFASSNAVMGRQKPPLDETKAALPIAPYGASKLAAEAYCMAYHGSFGLGTISLRFSNVYGSFCAHKSSVIPTFLTRLMAREQLSVYGDGHQTRDFIYVEDVTEAIMKALLSTVSGEVIQVASGTQTSIQNVTSILQRIVRRHLEVNHESPRPGDILHSYADIGKACTMLGWEPQIALEQGLQRTYEWFSQHPTLTGAK